MPAVTLQVLGLLTRSRGLQSRVMWPEAIAGMIEGQQLPFKSYAVQPAEAQEREIALGAQMLKVAVDLDQRVASGLAPSDALAELRRQPDEYNPEIVDALYRAKGMTASLLAE